MKLPRKPLSEIQHKYKFVTAGAYDYVMIDCYNNNFREFPSLYPHYAKIMYANNYAYIRYNNTIYTLVTL